MTRQRDTWYDLYFASRRKLTKTTRQLEPNRQLVNPLHRMRFHWNGYGSKSLRIFISAVFPTLFVSFYIAAKQTTQSLIFFWVGKKQRPEGINSQYFRLINVRHSELKPSDSPLNQGNSLAIGICLSTTPYTLIIHSVFSVRETQQQLCERKKNTSNWKGSFKSKQMCSLALTYLTVKLILNSTLTFHLCIY